VAGGRAPSLAAVDSAEPLGSGSLPSDPEPAILAREGAQIGRDYAARRRAKPGVRFQWPHRDGQSILASVREALTIMTAGHCSYCDGHPIDATGAETVDHFRPKSDPAFYELVCAWTNYFEYRFDSGQLHPASAATPEEQQRARRTIEILDLNRAGACVSRKHWVRSLRDLAGADDLADCSYRYLIPLCRAV
jgi:hypothetical protein